MTGTDATPCSNESQFTVTVRNLPTPSISGNNVICQDDNTTFTVQQIAEADIRGGQIPIFVKFVTAGHQLVIL